MRTRTTLAAGLLAAGVLALAGCGGGGGSEAKGARTTPASVAATATTPPTTAATTATKTAPSPSTTKPTPKPKPKPTDCMPARDIYVWMKVPGVPNMAQALGDYSNCGRPPTFDTVRDTAPTTEGTCTEAAWASDNPGYDPDAEPAKRLKHVQVSIGPAC